MKKINEVLFKLVKSKKNKPNTNKKEQTKETTNETITSNNSCPLLGGYRECDKDRPPKNDDSISSVQC
eukprot:8742351-Ditylum_brightwellii.AAC.1